MLGNASSKWPREVRKYKSSYNNITEQEWTEEKRHLEKPISSKCDQEAEQNDKNLEAALDPDVCTALNDDRGVVNARLLSNDNVACQEDAGQNENKNDRAGSHLDASTLSTNERLRACFSRSLVSLQVLSDTAKVEGWKGRNFSCGRQADNSVHSVLSQRKSLVISCPLRSCCDIDFYYLCRHSLTLRFVWNLARNVEK